MYVHHVALKYDCTLTTYTYLGTYMPTYLLFIKWNRDAQPMKIGVFRYYYRPGGSDFRLSRIGAPWGVDINAEFPCNFFGSSVLYYYVI